MAPAALPASPSAARSSPSGLRDIERAVNRLSQSARRTPKRSRSFRGGSSQPFDEGVDEWGTTPPQRVCTSADFAVDPACMPPENTDLQRGMLHRRSRLPCRDQSSRCRTGGSIGRAEDVAVVAWRAAGQMCAVFLTRPYFQNLSDWGGLSRLKPFASLPAGSE